MMRKGSGSSGCDFVGGVVDFFVHTLEVNQNFKKMMSLVLDGKTGKLVCVCVKWWFVDQHVKDVVSSILIRVSGV